MSSFTVIDNKTGKYPNCEEIALYEEWADELAYCDIDGFAITEDGNLILMDDCGNCAFCPVDRFTVVFEKDGAEVKHGKWCVVNGDATDEYIDAKCSNYGYTDMFDENGIYNYCPECGAKMDGGEMKNSIWFYLLINTAIPFIVGWIIGELIWR